MLARRIVGGERTLGRRGPVPAAILVLLLLLGACGGGAADDDAGGPAAEEDRATTSETAAPQEDATGVARQPAQTTDARIQISWYAQPETGGLWLAQEEGLFKERNVNGMGVTGGPGIDGIKQLATGKVDFLKIQADQVALARNQGIPIVMVASLMQRAPHGVMVHAESGITDLEDIAENGSYVYTAASSSPVFQYLIHKYGWTEDQLLAYQGQLADWLRNEDRAVMVYVTNEPIRAEKQGVEIRVFDVAELTGFNAYDGLATTEKMIAEQPELVHAVVEAWLEGWHRYFSDPEETLAYINELNPDLEPENMRFAFETLKNELVLTGDALTEGIGVMTKERWDSLYDQLKEIGVMDEALSADDAWTDEFFKDVIRPFEE